MSKAICWRSDIGVLAGILPIPLLLADTLGRDVEGIFLFTFWNMMINKSVQFFFCILYLMKLSNVVNEMKTHTQYLTLSIFLYISLNNLIAHSTTKNSLQVTFSSAYLFNFFKRYFFFTLNFFFRLLEKKLFCSKILTTCLLCDFFFFSFLIFSNCVCMQIAVIHWFTKWHLNANALDSFCSASFSGENQVKNQTQKATLLT